MFRFYVKILKKLRKIAKEFTENRKKSWILKTDSTSEKISQKIEKINGKSWKISGIEQKNSRKTEEI